MYEDRAFITLTFQPFGLLSYENFFLSHLLICDTVHFAISSSYCISEIMTSHIPLCSLISSIATYWLCPLTSKEWCHVTWSSFSHLQAWFCLHPSVFVVPSHHLAYILCFMITIIGFEKQLVFTFLPLFFPFLLWKTLSEVFKLCTLFLRSWEQIRLLILGFS